MAAVRESKNLLEQMYAEEVRKDSQTVQYLLGRYRVVCARMAQAAITGACAFRSPQAVHLYPTWQDACASSVRNIKHCGRTAVMLFDQSAFQQWQQRLGYADNSAGAANCTSGKIT